MRNRYDITDSQDRLDFDKYEWLQTYANKDQYTIENDGFLIDSYTLRFNDPSAETLYILRWE